MSANHRIDSLGDVARRRMDLAVTCLGCGRTRVYDPNGPLASYFALRGKSDQLAQIAELFHCRPCGISCNRLHPVSPAYRDRFLRLPGFPTALYVFPPGPAASAVLAAEKALADALAEPGTHPVVAARQADCRAELKAALRAWRDVIRRKLDV